MNWSRAKSLLIALLLCVDAFLLITFIMHENEARENEVTLREDVCRVLAAQGIVVSEDAIPLDSVNIRHATLESTAEPLALARKLFGEAGGSTSGENKVFSGSNGNIMFSDNSFSLVYESGTTISDLEDAETLAKNIASKLEVSTDSRDFIASESSTGYEVRIPQIFSGVRVFDCDIEFKISDSGSVIAHGKLIGNGKPGQTSGEVRKVSALMLDFADALKADGNENVNIGKVELGYIAKPRSSGVMILIPTLEISTDIGVFGVDMSSGEVSGF